MKSDRGASGKAASDLIEKLGVFYLGKRFDQATGAMVDEPILYDARDLTTHAVCLGMTGSGKTGLAISLLEEAAIDGIPAIVIDPKGDLANLLLTFPSLAKADFEPWVNPEEAARLGMTTAQLAAKEAARTRKGLAAFAEDGARIARLREAAEFTVYTPGSHAGEPISFVGNLSAGPPSEDEETRRDRVSAAASGLLTLIGVDADPIKSREQILLATILDEQWSQGFSVSLATLIKLIQKPPLDRIGVMDLETFFPARDRMQLALQLNGLLASPGFGPWMKGAPLAIESLLRTSSGKPRMSIVSIAHLSEPERMFAVTLLLSELLAYTRSRPGSTTLSSILYMDEIYGYLPPTANPPSKKPLLTLLKQARAFGLGVVLASQNPVDLDYKALSNIGTWFLGRLQTRQDKERLLDGLEGVARRDLDRTDLDRLLSSLPKRVFLLRNIHEADPVLFKTRHTLSYLRGPMTRKEIASLSNHEPATSPPTSTKTALLERPAPPPGVAERFQLPSTSGSGAISYSPHLACRVRLHFVRRSMDLDLWQTTHVIAPLTKESLAGLDAVKFESALDLDDEPLPGARFTGSPAGAMSAAKWKRLPAKIKGCCYRNRTLVLFRHRPQKAASSAGESEAAFRARCIQQLREKRAIEQAKIEHRFAPQIERLNDRIRRAEERVEREREQLGDRKMQTAISVGATFLGALFGRKRVGMGTIGRATTAARGFSRQQKERGDVERARQDVGAARAKLKRLQEEFEEKVADLSRLPNPEDLPVASIVVRPRKGDIEVSDPFLLWQPNDRLASDARKTLP